jgi:hypothetical protein
VEIARWRVGWCAGIGSESEENEEGRMDDERADGRKKEKVSFRFEKVGTLGRKEEEQERD